MKKKDKAQKIKAKKDKRKKILKERVIEKEKNKIKQKEREIIREKEEKEREIKEYKENKEKYLKEWEEILKDEQILNAYLCKECVCEIFGDAEKAYESQGMLSKKIEFDLEVDNYEHLGKVILICVNCRKRDIFDEEEIMNYANWVYGWDT